MIIEFSLGITEILNLKIKNRYKNRIKFSCIFTGLLGMLLNLKIGIKIGFCFKQFFVFRIKIGTTFLRKLKKIKENLGNLYTLIYLFLLYYLIGKYIYKKKERKYNKNIYYIIKE